MQGTHSGLEDLPNHIIDVSGSNCSAHVEQGGKFFYPRRLGKEVIDTLKENLNIYIPVVVFRLPYFRFVCLVNELMQYQHPFCQENSYHFGLKAHRLDLENLWPKQNWDLFLQLKRL